MKPYPQSPEKSSGQARRRPQPRCESSCWEPQHYLDLQSTQNDGLQPKIKSMRSIVLGTVEVQVYPYQTVSHGDPLALAVSDLLYVLALGGEMLLPIRVPNIRSGCGPFYFRGPRYVNKEYECEQQSPHDIDTWNLAALTVRA